jgi:ATP synthase I chain
MNMAHGPDAARSEAFLSGAYRRILRLTIVLSVVATITALLVNRESGVGIGAGSLLAYLNFAWLHHGTELLVQRMIAPSGTGPSRFGLMLAFAGRYTFVIAMAYVILKGYPNMRIAFVVGLAFPILAATCEGIYELFAGNTNQIPN